MYTSKYIFISSSHFQGEKEKKNEANIENSNAETTTATPSPSPSTLTQPFMQNMPYPFPPGTVPLNRFPFPPPFMNMPNQTNSRFPPPHAPFFPPMFPPGFLPQMGGTMPIPPWSSMHGCNHANASLAGQAPQTPTQVPQAPQAQKSSQSTSELPVEPSGPTTETKPAVSAAGETTAAVPAAGETTASVPATGETTVRHRVTENRNVDVRENLSQRAELHHYENRQQSGGVVTLVLIVFLGILISLLLLYRLYHSKIFNRFFPS